MNIIETGFEGLLIIEPKVFGDKRGYFVETWNRERYHQAGIPVDFVQDNLSLSRQGTLRGLHYQIPPQGKLISVLEGRVQDVVVDLRRNRSTFGKWFSLELDGESKRQLFIPPGFAHGFAVLSPSALFHYKCTELYQPNGEVTLLWNDPDIGVEWKVESPLLSEKDRVGLRFKTLPEEKLF
ncbi:MAG TPA: dTDP-4-dehydrorhamnose 3,5-epimerase [Verrucomicrobiota bacterium]|nr:dTDP-4-dehydrorhamnose 3,5-epimerase [Verrucomicrobiota bacterium]